MYVLQGQRVATTIVYVEGDIFMPVCKKSKKKIIDKQCLIDNSTYSENIKIKLFYQKL